MNTDSLAPKRRVKKRVDANEVIRRLGRFVSEMSPGDQLPTHTQLMRQIDASERSVLKALDIFHNEGKIVRINGKGTFVAEPRAEDGIGASGVSLTTVDSSTIITLSKPDHSFFDRCLQVLFNHAQAENLHVVCRLIDPQPEIQYSTSAISGKPLGFIVFRQDLTDLANQLQNEGNRVVMIGSPSETVSSDVPIVYGDHETGGYLTTQHLLSLGHRRIVYRNDNKARWRGAERANREAKRDRQEIITSSIDLQTLANWKSDPSLAKAYFRQPLSPTGMIAWNDHEATALLTILARAGVRVPEEVSVVGYDNLPEANIVTPALTTVDPGISQMIRVAVDMLSRTISVKRSQSVMVLPTLIPRDSTAPPRPE